MFLLGTLLAPGVSVYKKEIRSCEEIESWNGIWP